MYVLITLDLSHANAEQRSAFDRALAKANFEKLAPTTTWKATFSGSTDDAVRRKVQAIISYAAQEAKVSVSKCVVMVSPTPPQQLTADYSYFEDMVREASNGLNGLYSAVLGLRLPPHCADSLPVKKSPPPHGYYVPPGLPDVAAILGYQPTLTRRLFE